jgi:hypothetical protein
LPAISRGELQSRSLHGSGPHQKEKPRIALGVPFTIRAGTLLIGSARRLLRTMRTIAISALRRPFVAGPKSLMPSSLPPINPSATESKRWRQRWPRKPA